MILHRWGEIPYKEGYQKMLRVHKEASKDGKNHLIFCSHPLCYTVGKTEDKEWGVDTIQTDRGGSITCHSSGQIISYFCFQAYNPVLFYRKVLRAFNLFFKDTLPSVSYDSNRPGWYIDNRKIASIGFRYKNGVSLHGVSLNISIDLIEHQKIPPCGLDGVIATSLEAEGFSLKIEEVENILLKNISQSFKESIENLYLR